MKLDQNMANDEKVDKFDQNIASPSQIMKKGYPSVFLNQQTLKAPKYSRDIDIQGTGKRDQRETN